MKLPFILLIVLAFESVQAQVALRLPNPPVNAAVPFPAAAPFSAAGLTFTNEMGTNFTIGELSALLGQLQTNITIALPVLAAFNNSFDFVNIGVPGLGSARTAGVGLNPAGAGLNGPVATAGTSLSVGTSFPAGGLAPVLAGTNALGTAPLTRDTLRQLLVLEADMERMVPVLELVNAQTNFLVSSSTQAFVPGTLTNGFATLSNRFVLPLTNGFIMPLATPPPLAAPTGR